MNQFSDLKTNTVYYSELFKLRFPGIFETARCNLEANGVKVRLIGGNMNIWARDYMPIQVDDHFIQFQYKGVTPTGMLHETTEQLAQWMITDYDDYPWLKIPEKIIRGIIPTEKLIQCSLVLDGGGIIRSEKHAVITEKVFQDNKTLQYHEVISKLELLLGTKIVIIPIEPGDSLGHSDGICKFVDNETILMNDYSSMLSPVWTEFQHSAEAAFKEAGLKSEYMPYAYEQTQHMTDADFGKKFPFADDNNPGYGYYINFTLTKNTIIAPVFGIAKDLEAIATLRRLYPAHSVIAVDCTDLSYEGGLTNCTSWNVIE